ncbi:MAG TPA: hypothetical protein VHA79_02700 [Mycobacteriales bacterium]|jgi:hypothetical protein|nr:hypothetical protein [Mycobacteriales bacterium]
MAKRGARSDWQLDLRPASSAPRTPDAPPNGNGNSNGKSNGNGVGAAATWASADVGGSVGRTLAELRANDEAMLGALADIRATLESMSSGIEELAARVASVETKLASQAARPARPVRETSRTLRESSTGTIDRRARRGSLRITEGDTPD